MRQIKPYKDVSKCERQRRHKKWTDALESGKYKQCRFVLHNSEQNTFCCLGVACNVVKDLLKLDVHNSGCLVSYDNDFYRIPPKVEDYFGLRHPAGIVHGGPSLVDLNDRFFKTFNDIAKVIKSKPKGMFID